MESQVFDYELLRHSPNYGLKQYNEAIYRGELVNGKRNGLGVMQYRKPPLQVESTLMQALVLTSPCASWAHASWYRPMPDVDMPWRR